MQPPEPNRRPDPAGASSELDNERTAQAPAFPVVGVGASAGGLEAFTNLLRHLPPDPGLALILVQHLDPRHDSLLTTILAQATSMPVAEAKQGVPIEPNCVYVIPPNTQLSVAGGSLSLLPREGGRGLHTPVDTLFRSLADSMGVRAVGIVLSGGGSDGTLGLEAIKAAGGVTFAQDAASASQSSMPCYAAASGCVDFVLPVEEIARQLVRIGAHPYLTQPPGPAPEPSSASGEGEPAGGQEGLEGLFALLEARTGVDFSLYKRATIRRRLERRMAVLGLTDAADLLRLVQAAPSESEALFQELLLRVTSFFRDPEAFEVLQKSVFPSLVQDLPPGGAIRVWVAGCSTGEEAYSIAMALVECLEGVAAGTPIKILATDVNEAVLEKARAGTYLESIARDVSPERLRRFFLKSGGQYRISKSIRDLCVFARHNVYRDPPFARMDLVSCRNVLIYFDAALQRRVLPLFHYALRPGGFLLLGGSETVGTFTDLFSPVDRENSLYARSAGLSRLPLDGVPRGHAAHLLPAGQAGQAPAPGSPADLQRAADRVLARYAPPGVLLDENLSVVRFLGDTDPYLRNPVGTPSLEVLRMARDGLLPDLRQAILSAQGADAPARREASVTDTDGPPRPVAIQVFPLRAGLAASRCLLVLFEGPGQGERPWPYDAGTPGGWTPASPEEVDERLTQLRQELDAAREHLQSVTEEYEATNEELRSANEEILASNEELQSTNEALRTAKEEMQSANEELDTTNEELQYRNRELGLVNDDLTNLLAAAYIPVVMVSRDLRVRRFTAQAEKLFSLTPADVGRPIREIRSELDFPDLDQTIARVIDTLEAATVEVRDRSGHWHSLRVRPYETLGNRIDGAVLTVIDIDAVKRSEQEIRQSRDHVRGILDTTHESLLVLDAECRVRTANRSFYRTFQLLREEVELRSLFEVGAGAWDIPGLRELFYGVREGGAPVQNHELEHDFPGLGRRALRLNVRPLPTQGPEVLLLVAVEDITERRRAEQARRALEARMFHTQKLESLGVMASGVAHDLNNLLTPVLGYAELARHSLPDDAPAVALLRELEMSARQAADLVRQILAYSGKGHFVVRPVELSGLIREMSGLLRTAAAKVADLRYELADGLPAVEADATQLGQVVLNLVTNGSEAIEEGSGTVTVRTRLVHADQEMLRSPYLEEDLPPGPYVALEVEDTGCGMTAATKERVFDPFFTRKFTGRGLGLAAVLGIVRGHRGTIHVRSEPGQGSTFQLLLPCSTRQSPLAPTGPSDPAGWRGEGTILLVDDEPGVRGVAALVLERAGFTVLQAADGQEAVEELRKHGEPVAVLMDLTMPRMGGLEAAGAMRALRPGLPVVLMSGMSVEGMAAQYASEGVAGFVQKPFDSASLLAALRQALGQ